MPLDVAKELMLPLCLVYVEIERQLDHLHRVTSPSQLPKPSKTICISHSLAQHGKKQKPTVGTLYEVIVI